MIQQLLRLFLLWASVTGGASQIIGEEICSCAPNTYEFFLDFDLICPPVNITTGNAVVATSCIASPDGDPNVVDLIPVSAQSVQILELGQDLRVLAEEKIEGNFENGDAISYVSIAEEPDNIESSFQIPRAIQLNIKATNQFDEKIINVYVITFSNNCNAYPVLFEGQSAGWTRFVSAFLSDCVPIFPLTVN